MEIWKDVKGYEGLYQVSSLGRIKSLERKVRNTKNSFRVVEEKILKTLLINSGYLTVPLSNKQIVKRRTVHQLVAESFLDHKPNGLNMVVNHKNFDKKDNRISNLEVITVRENNVNYKRKGSSKYIGVSFNRSRNKWVSNIKIKGKNYFLGHYENEIDAHNAYQNKVKECVEK